MIQCYYLFSSHFHHPFQRKELVKDFGVYVKFVDLEQCGTIKQSGTGLMRSLISIFHSNERLVACSATIGILTSGWLHSVRSDNFLYHAL